MPRTQRSTPNARHTSIELRKEPTPAEAALWSRLRRSGLGISFRCQHAIGPYIVDFYSPVAKLVIEVDGQQHVEQKEYDIVRTAFFESQGCRVIRFWNKEVVDNIDGVVNRIREQVDK